MGEKVHTGGCGGALEFIDQPAPRTDFRFSEIQKQVGSISMHMVRAFQLPDGTDVDALFQEIVDDNPANWAVNEKAMAGCGLNWRGSPVCPGAIRTRRGDPLHPMSVTLYDGTGGLSLFVLGGVFIRPA